MDSGIRSFLAGGAAAFVTFVLVFTTSQILGDWLGRPWNALVASAIWLPIVVGGIFLAVLIHRRRARRKPPPDTPRLPDAP